MIKKKKKDISIADCKKTGTFLSLYLLLNYCGVLWLCVCECAWMCACMANIKHFVPSSLIKLFQPVMGPWIKLRCEVYVWAHRDWREGSWARGWGDQCRKLFTSRKPSRRTFQSKAFIISLFFMRLYTSSRLQEHPWCRWREHSRAFQNKTWIRCSDDFQLNTYKVVMTW